MRTRRYDEWREVNVDGGKDEDYECGIEWRLELILSIASPAFQVQSSAVSLIEEIVVKHRALVSR